MNIGQLPQAGPAGQAGNSPLTPGNPKCALAGFHHRSLPAMRDDYIKEALKSINDPNILINVVSRRVKQLKRGNRPLVESLEKLTPEDTALREIIEGKISHELASA
jgi:DNA-directed RNA polymerase subunit omega